MPVREINFDGIIGPSHNYAGLSLGNLASASHAGDPAFPRAAALQGLAKMRRNLGLGLAQGFLVPQPRPNPAFLAAIGADGRENPRLTAAAWSASAMWTANAATVSPAADTADNRCHFTPANLVTMPHRSQEWPDTARQLRLAFADPAHFVHHAPVPPCFGDEGAANHLRMATAHAAPGLEIFVYGTSGGAFPTRQHAEASRAVARLHRLDPARTLFVEQNPQAIAAGAFHNDVVAVANTRVLLTHELAFADPGATYAAIRERLPEAQVVVVPEAAVSLADAIRSYLFNAQLLSLPANGSGLGSGAEMALVIPTEAWEHRRVRAWLEELLRGNGPIRQVVPVDVRQSMANGGGPACLRLRVVADPATVDPRFLLDEARAEAIGAIITAHWPERITPGEIGDPGLAERIIAARLALLAALDLHELA